MRRRAGRREWCGGGVSPRESRLDNGLDEGLQDLLPRAVKSKLQEATVTERNSAFADAAIQRTAQAYIATRSNCVRTLLKGSFFPIPIIPKYSLRSEKEGDRSQRDAANLVEMNVLSRNWFVAATEPLVLLLRS